MSDGKQSGITAKELEELCKEHNPDDEVYFDYGLPENEDYGRWFPEAKDFKFKPNFDGPKV